MVVFTCNNCGETLQKPKVAKHYEFHCRTPTFVSCCDCFKDFRGQEYVAHTKCVTEAERYGGKDYVPKPNKNKGERKQQEWLNIVNNILNSKTTLSSAERTFLNALSKYENIPRKKAKFLNFVRSAMGKANSPSVIDSVWDKMESAYKNSMQNSAEKEEQNGKVDAKVDDKKNGDANLENNIVENQNNENICKENQTSDQGNKSNEIHGNQNGTDTTVKRKKSKKRTASETAQEQAEEPVSKKKSKKEAKQESISPDESKATLVSEPHVDHSNNVMETTSFRWKDTILDIVKSKGEISLKKLQKKAISQYMKLCPNPLPVGKATTKFSKKLKKVPEIVISDEKVRLA